MNLTKPELRRYRSEGYGFGGPLLDGEELARLGREVDAAIAALPAGRRPENMPSIHYDNPYFLDLLLDDRFLDVAEQILGPDLALFTVYAIAKRPRDGLEVAWHQDAPFFPITPMNTFTLWLAVDDSDSENGCMQVIPGSHRERRGLAHAVDRSGELTLPMRLTEAAQAPAVDVPVKAGWYSVHDPYLIHGSRPNRSGRRRCGVTIKYVNTRIRLDRSWVSPTGFDWKGVRLYHARGRRGGLDYAN